VTKHNSSQPITQSDLDSHKVTLTFFDDKFASIAYRDRLTLPELADEIRFMTDSSKAKLPWLKLATFGEVASGKNCLRTNANLLEITGIEVDYDAGSLSFDEAIGRLRQAGIRAIIYTSASYAKGVKEKWRVLAPLSEPHPAADRDGFVAVLNGVLGGGIDPASFNRSIAFYYGSVNENPEHRVEVLYGDFIDNRIDLTLGAIGRQPTERSTVNSAQLSGPNAAPGYDEAEIEALLQKSQFKNRDGSGNWHPSMVAVTASWVMKGLSDDEIFRRAEKFCIGGYGDPDLAQLVDGARAKWKRPDPDAANDPITGIGPIVAAARADAGLAPAVTTPDWRERYVNGRAKASLHNTRLAILALGIHCSADVFHNELFIGRGETAVPTEPLLPFFGQVTDAGIGGLRVCLSDTFGLDFTEKHVRDAVATLCQENAFNPVVEMLAEAEANWDGIERLNRVAVDHFNAPDTELNRQCVRKVMIAAVARARHPGCKFDTILVMESPEGLNKSSAWAVLAGEGNFSDQSILGATGREVQEQLAGIWIHENSELAGITKAEVEVIKAFASRQVDRARPAYGHFLVKQPRHSIEVATTNDREYLLSQTGNRRFWPLAVERTIDLVKLRAARLQLWGEAAHYQSKGESLVLDEALWPAAGVEQEARRVQHPWEARIAEMTHVVSTGLAGGDGYWGNGVVHVAGDEERVASSVIFDKVLNVASGQLNNGHAKTLASIMRRFGWERHTFELDGKTTKGYRRTKDYRTYR
jgi:hypothetical protein